MLDRPPPRYRKRKISPGVVSLGDHPTSGVLVKISFHQPVSLAQQISEIEGRVTRTSEEEIGRPNTSLFWIFPYDPENGFKFLEGALDKLELPDEVKGREVSVTIYDIQHLALLFAKTFDTPNELVEVIRENLQMVAEEDADMPVV